MSWLFTDIEPPEWAIDYDCPACKNPMHWDYMWYSDIEYLDDDQNDYLMWWMVCDECGTNYNLDDNNKPIAIE